LAPPKDLAWSWVVRGPGTRQEALFAAVVGSGTL
jgi:hypothetical protein